VCAPEFLLTLLLLREITTKDDDCRVLLVRYPADRNFDRKRVARTGFE